MSKHPDVLVIGGGLIGLTTAYFLAEGGASVVVVDKGDLGREASWAGAGILTPVKVTDGMPPLERLKALGSQMYPDLSKRLKEQTQIDNGYMASGGLEVFLSEADADTDEWRPHGAEFEELARNETAATLPHARSGLVRGFFIPGMAQVRNPRHVKALIAACQLRGVILSPNNSRAASRSGRRSFSGRRNESGTDDGRAVPSLPAAHRRPGLLESVGWHPGIRPIRGQIALLHPDRSPIRSLILCGKRYMVPRLDGRILVGSTEEDVGFDARTTATAIADLLEFSETLVPDLASAPAGTLLGRLASGSADGLPYLGVVPGCRESLSGGGPLSGRHSNVADNRIADGGVDAHRKDNGFIAGCFSS